MTDQEAAVIRGEQFLDEHFPGQLDAVDLNTLKMEDCVLCVLGQTLHLTRDNAQEYWQFVREYETSDWREDWQMNHGFQPALGQNGDWGALQELWRQRIEARRVAVN